MIESCEFVSESSRTYFFLPSVNDWVEGISQYLKNVSITPIDIKQEQLNVWADNTLFDPSKLDLIDVEKKITSDALYKCLERINNISNSNLVHDADDVLSVRKVDTPIDWVGENKIRVPSHRSLK